MNTKKKGIFILGLVLMATLAAMCLLTASAAVNGDADQTRDRTKDQIQDKDQLQDGSCTLVKDQIHLQTKLQIRDC